MDRFAGAVIRRRKAVIALFIIIAAVCALFYFSVRINYNMADYLPPEAQSTIALEMMNSEFTSAMPDAYAEVGGVTLQGALSLKHRLEEIEHVIDVIWLDDAVDITQPVEMDNTGVIGNYYKDGSARFSIVIEKGFEKEGISSIRELIGEGGVITGEAADIEFLQSATGSEVFKAIVILAPIIILILTLSTSSWIEPLLFLAAIAISVVINMGTNAFFGSVSFLTNSVTPILQLAVSLDYAIFLLHSFSAHRKTEPDIGEAMRKAVRESCSTIAASAATTLFGFVALLLMDFRIGADLGLSLAKGIVFSFISVMVFLPALTICLYKAIDKTRHRKLMPDFANINGVLRHLALPVAIIVAIIVVPCFLGQSKTDFLYGYQAAAAKTGEYSEPVWDDSPVMVLIVPGGDIAKEEMLSDDILDLPYVTSVMSYAKTVGAGIPPDILDKSIVEQFYSESSARIIISTNTPKEGREAFEAVEMITAAAEKYYPGEVYSAGQSANLYDIRATVRNDNRLTNLFAVIAIFIVLLITFKSAALPFILLLTIEAAIWINLSIPYFTGISINFIGYLVINTVQLGATVDYAILLTTAYMRDRQSMAKKEAIHSALGRSFRSILVSAATLATAGFVLAATSSNPIVSDIGMLLGRGALLSMLMVAVFLPAMLTIFDGFINKTTIKPDFLVQTKTGGKTSMKRAKSITTFGLALALMIGISVIPYAAGSQDNEQAPAERGTAAIVEKSEAVYARLSGSGEAHSIYVVNHFTLSKGGSINDYGNYTSVINLTDLEPISVSGGEVYAETESENYFYQGNLADNSLPWLYNIEYTLDGEKASPEELAGGEGNLMMHIISYRNTAINEIFYDNYMQQITVTLNIDKCRNIVANGAVTANAGKNRILTYTVMPGTDADIAITSDVKDFEMAGIEIAAMPFTMDIEITGTEDMLDDFAKLSDAIAELSDGAGKLDEGAAELKDGADELKSGSSDIRSGLSQLSASSAQLTETSSQIQAALSRIASGLSSTGDSGLDSTMADLAQLPSGLSLLAESLSRVSEGMVQLQSGYAQAYEALDGAIMGIPGLYISEEEIFSLYAIIGDSEEAGILKNLVDSYVAAMTVKGTYEQTGPAFASIPVTLGTLSGSVDAIAAVLSSTADQISAALAADTTIDQLTQLANGISGLAGSYGDFHRGLMAYARGISEIADGYSEFDSGVESFSDGLTEFYDGITALYDGIVALHDGTAKMADETSDMPDMIQSEIDSMVSEYTSCVFDAVSFTSAKNENVCYVQFVFVTDGIAKSEADAVVPANEDPQTFWDRLVQLFR